MSDERPWRMRRGDALGGWVLVAPLGQGGFSEVWRAHREGVEAALKVVVHPEHARQLRAEAQALAHVRGAGIVRVLEVALGHDPPYLVMSWIKGGSLRRRVRGVELVEALQLFQRVLEPLARVHREGVVHGDLKPENLLLGPAGSILLADFGLSRRITQRTATLSVSLSQEDARLAGTLDYMAPEQRKGERPTPRSDVYACGVILYELLVGSRPQGRFQLPGAVNPAVPPAIDRLLACCLAQDPRHRFATAGAILAYLRGNPWDDWMQVGRAYERTSQLLRTGGVSTLADTGGVIIVIGIVTIACGLMLFLSPAFTTERARIGGLVGLALGVALAAALAAALRPLIRARYEALKQLRDRLAAQLRTGQELAAAEQQELEWGDR